MSVGGSIQEISIRGRILAVAADADVSRKLGGFSSAVEMNGDGSGRVVKTRIGWALTGLTVDVNDTRGDHEFLRDIQAGVEADADGYYDISITYASKAVWSGRGTITEDVEYASMASTASISLAGPGQLTRQ